MDEILNSEIMILGTHFSKKSQWQNMYFSNF